MTTKSLGTAPVFFTALSTILGAIMFLRFGYAVGNISFIGILGIILIGHVITIATALSIAEIATNKKVEGGGEYFIISRSFGLNIGASIGVALYFSQAISVAFYIVAMMEAFNPILDWIASSIGLEYIDKRVISVPIMGFISWLMLKHGSKLGLKALYIVVTILLLSLVFFFLGSTSYSETVGQSALYSKIENGANFFTVFAIVFPAFTGMTAGVGLSGDLKNPSKSIPIGTLAATLSGLVIYVFIALKLAYSASPEDLNSDQLIMSKIAIWGPIIPLGLAAATFSSALGSMMVAPRTLQAIAGDNILPSSKLNSFLFKSSGKNNEPVNATFVTTLFATFFILLGNINFVAEIISMFFMVTYGSICLISFLEHFSADPSYRPTFRSRWYFSLIGAIMCFYLMFKMNFFYAILALIIMTSLYLWINYSKQEEKTFASIFKGVILQVSRKIQVFLQQTTKSEVEKWRPSIICVSSDSFKRYAAFDLLRWISHKYGFGTYIHLIEGFLTRESNDESKRLISKLLDLGSNKSNNIYIDTIVSPSYTTAITQVLQFPGISGKENNVILFEFDKNNEKGLATIIDNVRLVKALDFDVCILSTSIRGFGHCNEIHIWITPNDLNNANMMILLGFIMLGHPDWGKAQIKIYALFDETEVEEQKEKLFELIASGRLPISANHVMVVPYKQYQDVKNKINEYSTDADLTIIGFDQNVNKEHAASIFNGFNEIGNILFVNSSNEKDIS